MFNFKKLSAIGTSALMVGLTVGTAAAANYPAPFVVGGNADVAIVYGTGSGVSVLDAVEAGNLQSNLQSFMGGSSGSVTSTSGETVSIDTSADRVWLNTSLNVVKSTLTKSDLPTVLDDTSFDGDVQSDLTPTIKLLAGASDGGDNSGKVIFAKQPKSSTDPVVGISLGSSQTSNALYNASVTFSRAINFTDDDSEGETITLFGRDFVISTDTDSTDLVLFASAEEVTLTVNTAGSSSATVNVGGTDYTISLLNGDSTTATVQVGTDSKSIDEGDSKKVGGIEVAVKDVTSSDAAGITATLLVGSEKLTITNGATVTKGADEDPVDGTFAYIVGGTSAATEIAVAVFRADSSNDAILPGESFTDPVFENFKVDFAGLSSALDDSGREMISVENSGDKTMTATFTDEGGNTATFEFAHNNTHASNQADTPIYQKPNWRLADDTNTSDVWSVEGANLTEDDYVVVGNEEYGHLLQVIEIYNDTSVDFGDDRVRFQDVMSGTTYETVFTALGVGTVAIDGKQYTVLYANNNNLAVTLKYPTSESSTTSTFVVYPMIQTDSGAEVQLYEPLNVSLSAWNGTAAAATVINFPDGDGYTPVTFTYAAGGNATFATWAVSGASATVTSLGTASGEHYAYANYTVLTVGTMRYNVTGLNASTGTPAGNAVVNRTTIMMIDPEGNSNIDQPALIVYEGEDDDNNYHAIVVDLETAPAGSGDSGVGVNDVLFSSDKYHTASTLQSDSDITQDVDWWGSLVTTDATESDQKTVEISYPSSQVYAQIYVGELDSSVSSGSSGSGSSSLGSVVVKDTEVSSVQSKNLIVVGGSCINSVAAEALGGSYCGASFTEKTGVGSGQFMIQSVGDVYTDGKVALVVAGYEVADTVNAATYLRTKVVDTSADKKYVGTTATTAELQVA